MIENLNNLVKENADSLENDAAIPADNKDEIVKAAGTSIFTGLQNSLSQGGVDSVMGLFDSKSEEVPSHPVTQQISGNFVQELSSKFGISATKAATIASSLIPTVLSKLVHKTNDPSDKSFNIQDIFDQLTSGKTSGMNIGSIFAKFKSRLDFDKDGDVDLQDFKSLFTGEGGIVGKVKGMFK